MLKGCYWWEKHSVKGRQDLMASIFDDQDLYSHWRCLFITSWPIRLVSREMLPHGRKLVVSSIKIQPYWLWGWEVRKRKRRERKGRKGREVGLPVYSKTQSTLHLWWSLFISNPEQSMGFLLSECFLSVFDSRAQDPSIIPS